MTENLSTKDFTVLDHNYMNTGGHCMVSVFTVYDKEVRALRYVVANDEGFNWQTMDTVGHEPPADLDYDEVILDSYDWDALTSEPSFDQHQFTDEEFALFKYCQFEFYKCYCKTFDKISLPVNWLPNNLYETLELEAIEWHNNHGMPVITDGYSVWPNENYEPSAAYQNQGLQDIKVFKQWFSGLTYDQDFLDRVIDGNYGDTLLVVGDRALRIPLTADTYTLIEDFLNKVIEEL